MRAGAFVRRITIAATSVVLVACRADHADLVATERLSEPIIGAQRPATAYPEAVRVKVNNAADDFCTGVIVAPRLVLTAAHCVVFNPGGTWTLIAPFAGGGAQTRTASSAQPLDAGFANLTRSNFDAHPEFHDLGFLYPDSPFTNITPAILSATRVAAGATVSAVGRQSVSASAGLVLSAAEPLSWPTAGDFYTREYKTPRITDGGDSGGPLFVDGTHQVVGTERVFDNTDDHWTELYGSVYDSVVAQIDATGGYGVIAPAGASVAPKGSATFSVTNGLGAPVTWMVSTNHSGGAIDAAGVYTAGAIGSVTDIARATDGSGKYATVAVSVGAGVSIGAVTSTQTAPLGTLHFNASGGSGAGYVWSFATNASAAAIGATTGIYTAGGAGSVTDTIRATDSLGNTGTLDVTVTAALAISPTTKSLPPRGAQAFTATGGSGSFTFALEAKPSGGAIDGASGAYTAGAVANVLDTVKVTDSFGAVARATMTIGSGVDIAPKNPSAPIGGAIAFGATGGSGTGYGYVLTTNASGATVSADGAYHAGTVGLTTDTLRVTDSLGNFTSVDIPVGMPLTIRSPQPTTPPRGRIALVAIGGSGAGYAWSLAPGGSGGSIDAATGAFVAGATGDVHDTIVLVDSLGNQATADESVGDPVRVTPKTSATLVGGELVLGATGGDGTYTFAFATNASGGAVDAVKGTYVAGPTSGADTVVVTDALGNSDRAEIAVTVRSGEVVAGPRDAGASTTAPTPAAAASSSCAVSIAGATNPGTSGAAFLLLLLARWTRRASRARCKRRKAKGLVLRRETGHL